MLQFLTNRLRRRESRGTVLVFVLGMLVLLFFIGFTLLANTRGERQKVVQAKVADNFDSVLANLQEQIQIRLRDDVWNIPLRSAGGQPPGSIPPIPTLLSDASTNAPTDAQEHNE